MSSQEQRKYYQGIYDPRKIDEKTAAQIWTSESVDLAIDGLRNGYKLRENPFVSTIKDVKLRRASLPFKYSEDEMFAIRTSIHDKIWFADNFGVLKDGEKGWTRIKLRDYQKNLLHRYSINRNNIILFPRQSGKTTTTVLEIVHYIISNVEKDIVVIAQSDTVVDELFNKVKLAIAGLPFFMQPGIVNFKSDEHLMTFDNGCRFKCGIASEATVQGFALDFLYIDEFAYIRDSLAPKFWGNVYPTLSNNPNSKCIITSTPKGRNLFYTLWNNAINKKNSFVPYKIYWYDVPGRDEAFKQKTISDIGEEFWEMGFELSFDTELKSIFASKTQKNLRQIQTSNEDKWSVDNHYLGGLFDMEFISQDAVPYDIKNDWFLLGVDIGEGLGQDSSVLKLKKIIFDPETSSLKYLSVGIYENSEISPDDFAMLTLDFIKHLNLSKLKVVVENNNYGGEYFNQIKNIKLQKPQTYGIIEDDVFALFERESKNGFEKGIRWNASNKKFGVKYFQKLIGKQIMEESHSPSIEQYLNFGRKNNDTFSANYGHDDLVMADVTLSYFIQCNNVYATLFLETCKYELRQQLGILTEEEIEKEIEKRREDNAYENNGYKMRDHEKEVEKREGTNNIYYI